MITIVESSRNSRNTLGYNEEKLAENKAIFLGAFNYCQEDNQLTFDSKLQRLRGLAELNERSQANTIHLSLNFHPDEKLEDRKMRRIARELLQKIDFGAQPALVYRHLDAGHPHAHIVTVNIRSDGSRIPNDLRSPHHLQSVCAELEHRHQLIPAGMQHAKEHSREERKLPMRLKYGKTSTKTGIQNTLDHVLPNFNYTSLDELNAVLSLYGVQADRGSEQGLMYQSRGLYYRMVDDRGVKIGAPVKASAFKDRPTLNYLEQKFGANRLTRDRHLRLMQATVSLALSNSDTSSLETWRHTLLRENIELVIPRTPIKRKHAPTSLAPTPLAPTPPATATLATPPFDGHAFYYVDVTRNTVFRDTTLGPDYTAQSILRKTGLDKRLQQTALNHRLELEPRQQRLLTQTNPDPREKLRLLLDISPRHDQIIAARLDRQDNLRQQHRQRLSH